MPSRRGEGVVPLLLAGLVDRARADAYGALSVSVERDQPGLGDYEDAGFEPVEQRGPAAVLRRPLP